MTSKFPIARRQGTSAPAPPAPPATPSGGTLRRVAPPTPAVTAPTPVAAPKPARNVIVIAQIPNLKLARTPARITAELAAAGASSPPRALPSLPPAAAPDAPPPAPRFEATPLTPPVESLPVESPPVELKASVPTPPASATPQPATVPELPKPEASAPTPSVVSKATPSERLRWLENLPEWQRLGLQAVVMIAAAILVVVTFAWWRNPDSPADPLPRRPAKLVEGDGELLRADASPSMSAASVARKTTPPGRLSHDSNIQDERPPTAAPARTTERFEESAPLPLAPPTTRPPTTGAPPPAAVPPTTDLTPSATNAPALPALESSSRAAYPSYPTTDPQRFQFRVPEYAEGGRPTATNPPRDGDYQPAAETARLGEIAPFGPGNIR